MTSTFTGFPPELFTFFDGLAADNTTDYWHARKAVWESQVRAPMRALLAELGDEFGPLRMFRPNRDVRFSKDKSPYKLWAGATSETRAVGGIGYHLEVSAGGLVVGFGAMLFASDQLARFRAALDNDLTGTAFETISDDLAAASLPLTSGAEPPLKTTPRGYLADHPRAGLLRWKGAAVVQQHPTAHWMHTPEPLNRVRHIWRATNTLKHWLDTNVGPSDKPAR
ncbi:MAG: DUF2461 domain-containing protein [Phycisphaerales bacterium]